MLKHVETLSSQPNDEEVQWQEPELESVVYIPLSGEQLIRK